MKRQVLYITSALTFVFMVSLTTSSNVFAQDNTENLKIETWSGALDAGGATLRLKLEITGEGDDLTAVLISIDQGSPRIPVEKLSFEDNELAFTTPVINGQFTGGLNEEGNTATGTWSQNGLDIPLSLTRDEVEK